MTLSQVVGVPDERMVKVPAAFVQCRAGAAPTGQQLVDDCRERISRFKVPRYVVFVEHWPMSATKIQKFKLKDQPLGDRYAVGAVAGWRPRPTLSGHGSSGQSWPDSQQSLALLRFGPGR